jgi:Anaphase-promoting complex, cyclosome, subunit 3
MGAPPSHLKGLSIQEAPAAQVQVPADADADAKDTPSSASMEETYTSLIQQYLSVFCVDNATFFAERLVATSRTNHSLYLLALCYYRDQRPQRAIVILEQAKSPSTPMQFLLAKCHYDLEAYGPAEEAMLRQCRSDFRKQGRGQDDMNDFILTATVSAHKKCVCDNMMYDHVFASSCAHD